MKRAFSAAITCVLLMHPMLDAQTTSPQAVGLTFFKNYFITGDYVVAGVNLRGLGGADGMASGIIDLSDGQTSSTETDNSIPDGVDLVAAFLYWETVQTSGPSFGSLVPTFRGKLPTETFDAAGLSPARIDISLIARVLNPSGTAPCWSSGGGTGSAEGAHQMFAYRADVLRFIPIDPTTGKRKVKTQYEVRLPDAGAGNKVPSTAGASLVVVYKDPSKPLKSIVIYNGGYTMDNSTRQMTRTIQGFYQAGTDDPTKAKAIKAKMTHIVGDGSTAKSDQLLFGSGGATSALSPLGTNLFQGLVTASADPAWDNLTVDVSSSVTQDSSLVTTRVQPDPGVSPFDCLSWGALVFSTTVQDSDGDGLVDTWELPHATPLTDPTGRPLPDLYDMGARFNHKDVFVEIGAMTTTGYANPIQGAVPVPAHNHTPKQAALDMVGDAFKNAPVGNPDGVTGIKIHFDVGNQYQTKPGLTDADPYIVPTSLARGAFGEEISETACVPSSTNPCIFPSYPGTVGWKTGYRVLRDQPLNYTDEDSCAAAELQWTAQYLAGLMTTPPTPPTVVDCVRRSDHNRKDMFHYALFAHAIGLPRPDPTSTSLPPLPLCVNSAGTQVACGDAASVGEVPRNVSGTADGGGSGGGDLMVTLGFWDNSVGTDFMQASTLMHELGHNFGLRHGGGPPIPITGGFKPQPNCKPNYESVMSYLFQVGGLLCDSASALLTPQCVGRPAGDAVIDYSRQVLGGTSGLSETALTEQPPSGLSGGMIYRTRWFSRTSDLDTLLGTPPASRYCDGTRIPTDGSGNPVETGFRIDGTSLTAVDWNGDLAIDAVVGGQNVNFIGGPANATDTTTDGPFKGFNDWLNIDLRQVGSRRNVASHGGPLSLDQGQGDNGQGDNGQGDNGQGDNGQGDNGQGDNGQGDNGQGDNGQGDNGVDADLDGTRGWGNAVTLLAPTVTKQTIVLTWTPPHVDVTKVADYSVYRVTGTAVTHATLVSKVLVSGNSVSKFTTTVVDADVKNNTTYTYWVQARLDINNKGEACGTGESCLSGISNYQTIKK